MVKHIVGIRFSEHGQVLACVHESQPDGPGLERGQGVMAHLEYGHGFGKIVWFRELSENGDIQLEQAAEAATPVPSRQNGHRACGKEQHADSGGEPFPDEIMDAVAASGLPPARLATEEEHLKAEENALLCREARVFCRRCVADRGLDMKLVDVETLFDRSKMIFYFTAPTRIDFRELVKDLVRQYRTRIELRQIGVRHETQMLGALGNCGMVCCCRRYLRKFAPVTIKMAKEQNLFLNPAKISGICGRLLCCLSFEQQNYDEFHRACPKLGKRYQTTEGPMRVLRGNMFRNSVVVLPDGGQETEMTLEEWKAIRPHRAESPLQSPKDPPKAHTMLVVSAAPDTLDNDLADLESQSMAEPASEHQETAPKGRSRKRKHASGKNHAPQGHRPGSGEDRD